jgi:hypothetical protein
MNTDFPVEQKETKKTKGRQVGESLSNRLGLTKIAILEPFPGSELTVFPGFVPFVSFCSTESFRLKRGVNESLVGRVPSRGAREPFIVLHYSVTRFSS